jgi:hypothetical protein
MLIYHLYVLIILTCSMTSFSDKYCVCYYPCEGPNSADLPLFGSFLQHFFSIFVFEQQLNLYYSVSRVLLRPLGGVIFMTVFITLFTLCPFVTKRGSNFYFGPGMYFQTGQVIFVPEWPKGEFVSILTSFCVWTKSLICKDAANRDSTVQSEVRRISKFLVSRPDDVSSRPDDVLYRPNARQSSIIRPDDVLLPSGHFTVSRSFCASLLRPDVSAERPNA